MPKPKLCQIIAIVNGRKSAAQKEITRLHHACQKEGVMAGISRVYRPRDEDGESLPPEAKRIQGSARKMLDDAAKVWTDVMDVVLTQDAANRQAGADIVVGGETIAADVPVTNLLYLEKQLTDIQTFIDKIPTLDPAAEWEYDANIGCYRTEPIEQVRTKKIQKPIVLYEATKEHPAQVQLATEDVPVGTWSTTFFSGAIPADEKMAMLDRVRGLQEAVKKAREAANSIEVADAEIGKSLFAYILG